MLNMSSQRKSLRLNRPYVSGEERIIAKPVLRLSASSEFGKSRHLPQGSQNVNSPAKWRTSKDDACHIASVRRATVMPMSVRSAPLNKADQVRY